MKDSRGSEIKRGDLVLLVEDHVTDMPTELVIFVEQKTNKYVMKSPCDNGGDPVEKEYEVDSVIYYPLSDYGLEVAAHDAGVVMTQIHRNKKYEAVHVSSDNVTIMNADTLRGYSKTLYNAIAAVM